MNPNAKNCGIALKTVAALMLSLVIGFAATGKDTPVTARPSRQEVSRFSTR